GPQLTAAEREAGNKGKMPFNFALATGQLKIAEQLWWPGIPWSRLELAELRGDKSAVQKIAKELDGNPLAPRPFVFAAVRAPYLLARAGLASRAKQQLDEFFVAHTRINPAGRNSGYGSAALGMGNTPEAIGKLRIAVEHFAVARQIW